MAFSCSPTSASLLTSRSPAGFRSRFRSPAGFRFGLALLPRRSLRLKSKTTNDHNSSERLKNCRKHTLETRAKSHGFSNTMNELYLIPCKGPSAVESPEIAYVLHNDPDKGTQCIGYFVEEPAEIQARREEAIKLKGNAPYCGLLTYLLMDHANHAAEFLFAAELSVFICLRWGVKREPIYLFMIGIPAFFFFRVFASLVQPSTLCFAVASFSVMLLGYLVHWFRLRA